MKLSYTKSMTNKLSGGTVHKLPKDMQAALLADKAAQVAWQDITALARNEFICWVENAKADETRQRRIRRTVEELDDGQRRPCCWGGCIHRDENLAIKKYRL